MRLVVEVLGRRLLEVSTEAESASPPALEASSGGQFEMGFSAPRSGEVTCRDARKRP